MTNTRLNNSLKIVGTISLLANTLAISDSAFAINLTISNTNSSIISPSLANLGQSFINDPSGNGSQLLLNDWTFGFGSLAEANNVKNLTLSIYNGVGNGGVKVGDSTGAANTTFVGFNSVVWTFFDLKLTDNLTYTAVINGASSIVLSPNSYSNGTTTFGASTDASDTLFRGNFTPVPFEFEPTGGLAILGGAWVLRRHLQKKKAAKV